MPYQRIKFYQTGSFAVGNRLLTEDRRSVQSVAGRSNALTCGHRACQGCGEALGARYALDAVHRATGGQMIAVNATGCLEVFSTPFPADAVREALAGARRVVVLECALAPGSGGIVTADVRAALGSSAPGISTVIAGLGGRAVTKKSLRALLQTRELPPLTFLDLDTGLADRELARMRAARRSGPSPENMLRDLGITASKIG